MAERFSSLLLISQFRFDVGLLHAIIDLQPDPVDWRSEMIINSSFVDCVVKISSSYLHNDVALSSNTRECRC